MGIAELLPQCIDQKYAAADVLVRDLLPPNPNQTPNPNPNPRSRLVHRHSQHFGPLFLHRESAPPRNAPFVRTHVLHRESSLPEPPLLLNPPATARMPAGFFARAPVNSANHALTLPLRFFQRLPRRSRRALAGQGATKTDELRKFPDMPRDHRRTGTR